MYTQIESDSKLVQAHLKNKGKKKTIRFFGLWGFMGCRWNLDTTISAKVGAITVISHVKIPFLGLVLSSRAQLETGDVTHSQTPIRGEAGELTF